MGDWLTFYSGFWRDLASANHDLPLSLGYHTRAGGEPDRAYQGDRHATVRNAYCHIRFTGRGRERDLGIEYFTASRADDDWRLLMERVTPRVGLPLQRASTGISTETARVILRRGLTHELSPHLVHDLIAESARTYRNFLAAWRP